MKKLEGPCILTIFMYLNDVEEGGGTGFQYLNFTEMPKKGTDMKEKEDWTWHEALTLTKSIKYGANAWIHLRPYHTCKYQWSKSLQCFQLCIVESIQIMSVTEEEMIRGWKEDIAQREGQLKADSWNETGAKDNSGR